MQFIWSIDEVEKIDEAEEISMKQEVNNAHHDK